MSRASRRLHFFGVVLEAARQGVLRLRHHRALKLVVLVAVLLFAASWLLAGGLDDRENGRSLFCILVWWVHGTVLMPWAVLYLGVQAVHGAIEDRTFQYLFLRPVGRVPLLLGNWLAVAIVGAAIGALGTLAVYAGFAAHGRLPGEAIDAATVWVFVRAFAGGAVAYAAAAVFFSAALRRPLVWGAFFVVGLQQLTANLPVSAGLRRLTITDPLRRMVLDGIEPDVRLAQQLWPAERGRIVVGEFGRGVDVEQLGEPWLDLAWFVGVTLALAAFAYRRSEYDSRHRE